MDVHGMAIFMRELRIQAEAAHVAASDLQAVLNAEVLDIPRAFAYAQSLLAAGAMVSKVLWPQPVAVAPSASPADEATRERTVLRGRQLRKALAIKGISVLENRKVRNSFEHFDDRLDAFVAGGPAPVIDRNLAPRDAFDFLDGGGTRTLRWLDPSRMTISVMDEEVSLQDLYNAIMEVAQRASGWLEAEASEYDRI